MPTPEPKTLQLYEQVLRILHARPNEMSIADLRKATGKDEPTDKLVEGLLNQVRVHSPVMRTDRGIYQLTPWARAQMDADGTFVPTYPENSTTDGQPTAEQEEHIVAAFKDLLRAPSAAVLEEPSYAQLIQHLSAARHDLVAELSPSSLQRALELALRDIDEETQGSVFLWKTPEGPPQLVRARGESWSEHALLSSIDSIDHQTRLEYLEKALGLRRLTTGSIDQVAHLHNVGSKRVYLGRLGETITRPLILALHDECQPGEEAYVYLLGRITPNAQMAATRLGVHIKTIEDLRPLLNDQHLWAF
ncbi:hypothetical protein [Deinococcus sp. UYEF24]